MDIPTPSNVNHGFSQGTDGFLNIPIESTNLDPLSTKRRSAEAVKIESCELPMICKWEKYKFISDKRALFKQIVES